MDLLVDRPRPRRARRLEHLARQDAGGAEVLLPRRRGVERHVVDVEERRRTVVVGHVDLGDLQHPGDGHPLRLAGLVVPQELRALDAQDAARREIGLVGRVGQLPLDLPGGLAPLRLGGIEPGGGEPLLDGVRRERRPGRALLGRLRELPDRGDPLAGGPQRQHASRDQQKPRETEAESHRRNSSGGRPCSSGRSLTPGIQERSIHHRGTETTEQRQDREERRVLSPSSQFSVCSVSSVSLW